MNLVVIEDTYLTVKYKSNQDWLDDDVSTHKDENDDGRPEGYRLSATSQDGMGNLGEMYSKAPAQSTAEIPLSPSKQKLSEFKTDITKNILKSLITHEK